ncbi:hypothetical protein BOSE62_40428 [Bosea sp. 62]|nr:hypothetical protein BOSE46_120357 [Bosea sp. 46]CAD5261685.1 hypothetical protein BOSE21B_110582 [Bosea sp. 21B]CAD5278871.1 hypothetical protein BOSE7B_40634 [Bosea sp. 7B]VVT58531.1 hypothetical protein BOS5A_200632 [Bosea sp. EC-HK365B]VXB55800.1 hypothetical protein BOSE29B_110521 [Bosea sp. 29B]VXB97269.1 hypothetical protein BOSE125_160313 [Bosea sp. 125]VXC44049.1 hypothetical protein BOSE62_40428 [Bosea sp. 62]VXC82026.1 hypothetical protein BOSE127_60032 [Bosea sp. 127]
MRPWDRVSVTFIALIRSTALYFNVQSATPGDRRRAREIRILVRAEGLEPPRLSPLVPKTSASTSSATPADPVRHIAVLATAAP